MQFFPPIRHSRRILQTYGVGAEFLLVEKSPSHHLLAEGQDVGGVFQAPVFMRPELAGAAAACLNLVHQETAAVLFKEIGKSEVN